MLYLLSITFLKTISGQVLFISTIHVIYDYQPAKHGSFNSKGESMITKSDKRLESVRVMVDEMLIQIGDAEEKRCAYLHLYGVSQFAAMLAQKRGLDPELAAIAGMFHDFYAYKTNIHEFHAQNGAESARPIIRDLGIFTKEEQKTILSAIFHHSDKNTVNDVYDEIVKDADVLQHYYYNVNKTVHVNEAARLKKILNELFLPCDFQEAEEEKCSGEVSYCNQRKMLADIAEILASKEILGIPADEDYRDICRYWPDNNIHKELRGGWCAAFVYHCCKKAGFSLPIRYPGGSCRFAGVYAWLEWARLEDVDFFHSIDENSYMPERGDIVIYEKLIFDKSNDHIGIVLSCEGSCMLVAEGNIDNKNQSGIISRSRYDKILGFIRIDNNYKYKFSGIYDPKLD